MTVPALVLLIGGGLVVYGVVLIVQARGTRISPSRAWIVVGLDAAWVLGSVVVLLTGWLSTAGNWTVAGVAGAVLLFAVLQSWSIRTVRRAQ